MGGMWNVRSSADPVNGDPLARSASESNGWTWRSGAQRLSWSALAWGASRCHQLRGRALDFRGGPFSALIDEYGGEYVGGLTSGRGWSFGVDVEHVAVGDVDVGALAPASEPDVERFAGGRGVDDGVGGVHGASLGSSGRGGVAELDVPLT